MARKTKLQACETRLQIIDAARTVFHQWGVSRSSLDRVAREAGLTRGAIYWHFKDKAELFLAVRANVLFPVFEEIDAIIGSDAYVDPLDGIEAALRRFFQILENCPDVRMVLETIVNRCERVAEFASVQSDLDRPTSEFLAKLEYAYREAAALGTLRTGLDPKFSARDTWAFTYGLMYRLLAGDADGGFRNHVPGMIALHLSLRRFGQMPHGETLETTVCQTEQPASPG
jgi:TetR/AcrR family acrAB operon transcriptional repressor